jgi:transcriptional regulator
VYIPGHFRQADLATLHAFMDAHGFALLCSAGEGGTPFASHLPLLLDRLAGPFGTLVGHMARANPQWRHADGRPVLAVFSGPHAYVSPSWYEAEEVVPTWNYAAVHAAGVLRAVHGRDALREIVAAAVARYEAGRPRPWRLDPAAGYLDRMLGAIVGFRVEIATLEGKWKLSQNHPPERRARVVRALREQGGEDAAAVADLMDGDDGGER